MSAWELPGKRECWRIRMGYIDDNLITGEQVTYRARLHWSVLTKPFLLSLLLAAAAAVLFYVAIGGNNSEQTTSAITWTGIGILIVGAIPLVTGHISRSSAEFAVTNKRVILKTGFIQKKTAEMFLNKIESVGVDQSIPGRMFNYGSIVIRGTGGSLEPFEKVSAPLEFRRQIQEQIGKAFGPAERSSTAEV